MTKFSPARAAAAATSSTVPVPSDRRVWIWIAPRTGARRSAAAEIVRAVISLGRALKIPVIAEGVETEGVRAFLMLEGCEELQGYLIGRPAPVAAHADLINGEHANALMTG